jgi:hypothetical protein
MANRWTYRPSTVGAMAEQRWIVECEDLFGRERGITVLSHAGWIVVVTPAGEAAVLSGPQVERLAHALDAAVTPGPTR